MGEMQKWKIRQGRFEFKISVNHDMTLNHPSPNLPPEYDTLLFNILIKKILFFRPGFQVVGFDGCDIENSVEFFQGSV